MSISEKIALQTFSENVFKMGNGFKDEKFSLDDIGELIPGLLHLNRKDNLQMTYLSKRAEKWAGLSFGDIENMGGNFFKNHLEQNAWLTTAFDFRKFTMQEDIYKTHSDLIYYRLDMKQSYQPLLTNIKLIPETNFILSVTTPLNGLNGVNKKLSKAQEVDIFFKKNYAKFQLLTKREVEILKLIAKENTNKRIGERLFISENTVRTHRNRIYKKLDINHVKDAVKYAFTYDLL